MPTFHFDLVSPERLLFSGEVDQVDLPGADGDFGVLAGHSPLVATLKPGMVTVHAGGRQERIAVFGGFAEVSPAGLTLLADGAMPAGQVDRARIQAEIRRAEENVAAAPDGQARDRAQRTLDEMRALGGTAQAT